MRIRNTHQKQLSFLPYSLDNIQWNMLPKKVRHDVQTLLAQLLISTHRNNQSTNKEAVHVTENN